jgi:hypothetical protein
MQDFINSKSMATPGLAGGMIMLIANSINLQFELGHSTKWLVLGLSFLVGLVIIADNSLTSKPAKAALYVFNSLIIFCMATGTNSIGQKVEGTPSEPTSNIKPLVKKTDSETPKFTFTLTVLKNQDTLRVKSEQRKKELKNQAIDISKAIQSTQHELINNHNNYSNAQARLNELNNLNEQLLNVHSTISSDGSISHTEDKNYKFQLKEVQTKVNLFQTGLKKGKPQTAAKNFFADW